ncbi:hypothetical protein NUW58_g1287 [Xylaria curta]|uniref:Uncharacterized protein n=1 Tax=Xylaria curta TaxID=42375 RepID=A0ACC1PNF3_9PEZI|nr:hypothetical protein NUW58_g1287 [Xylaria curta]
MANTNLETALHQAFVDHGLIRVIIKFNPRDVKFINQYISLTGDTNPSEWISYSVENQIKRWDPDSGMDESLTVCAIAPAFNTYVTALAFTTLEEGIGAKRLTPMRLRDMMVSNYITAGGDLKTWRWIGTAAIINEVTRAHAMECFREAGKDLKQNGSVQLLHSDIRFAEHILSNPFTRGIQNLLREYRKETADARIKRIIFIADGIPVDWEKTTWTGYMPRLYLVVELFRPGDEGYPPHQTTQVTKIKLVNYPPSK